jgi:hypothetical protein
MKRLFLAAALAASALVASPALAADLPVKAPPLSPIAYPYDGGSGFYFGINTMAGVAQANVNGVAGSGVLATSLVNGNLTAAGGAVGGTVGWIKGTPTSWFAIEASLDYQNITAGNAGAPVSVASRWSSEQVVKFGGTFNPLSYLPDLGVTGFSFPAFQLPIAPAGISVALSPHPYVMAGVKEFGITGTFGGIGGTTWGVAPLVGAGTISQILDKQGKPTGAALDLFAEVVFAGRGITVDNIGGVGGAPMFGGSANLGNQYFAGAKILW